MAAREIEPVMAMLEITIVMLSTTTHSILQNANHITLHKDTSTINMENQLLIELRSRTVWIM